MDRAVAVVGDRVLTASEVRIATALSALDPAAMDLLRPPQKDHIRWWLEQVVLRQLAGDSEVYQPSGSEVRERVELLLEAASDSSELDRLAAELGLARAGIDAWVYNRLVVERFVSRNLGPSAREAADSADRYGAWVQDLRKDMAVRRIAPLDEGDVEGPAGSTHP